MGLILPPTQRYRGAVSPGVKRHGREADRSPSSSAEVNECLSYTSIFTYAFLA
jgi:hypothetical protein